MDVTSLLNTSSAAKLEEGRGSESPDQTPTPSISSGSTDSATAIHTPSPEGTPPRRFGECKLSIRSRTPWDAGGYSLPLTLDTKSIHLGAAPRPVQITSQVGVNSESSPLENLILSSASPHSPSPRHKFSDSRSSLSSYSSSSCSSAHSISHSRISSLSTVSEFQPLSAFATEPFSSLDSRMQEMGSMLTCPVLGEVQPPSPAPMATTHEVASPSTSQNQRSQDNIIERARSPSDAILIGRLGISSEANSPVNTRPDLAGNSLLAPDSSPTSRLHKRALSAPNIPPIMETSAMPLPSVPAPSDLPSELPDRDVMASSHETEDANSIAVRADDAPTDVKTQEELVKERMTCSYVKDCSTGSSLRKAISHIFGRNKLCTRMIPPHAWVYWCRKHYQRSRYRNAENYARDQVGMVQTQINYIQEWSDENKANGRAGVVQDWTLACRKREKNRHDESVSKTAPGGGRKRPAPADKDSGDDDDGDYSDGESRLPGYLPGRAADLGGGTSVPQWLRNKCRGGYDTDDIRAIVEEIKAAMESKELSQIPDIEILPNITMDTADENRSRPTARRRSSVATSAHRRSQSLQSHASVRPDSNPMLRRVSQPSYQFPAEASHLQPIGKRQRVGEIEDGYGDPSPLIGFPSRSLERTVPVLGRPIQFAHRSAISDYRDSRGDDGYFPDRPRFVAPSYNYPVSASLLPLPAPTAQRLGSGPPVAQHLEASTSFQGFPESRRALHQRSYSEIGNPAQYHQPPYRPVTPPGFSAAPSTAPYNHPPLSHGYGHGASASFSTTYSTPASYSSVLSGFGGHSEATTPYSNLESPYTAQESASAGYQYDSYNSRPSYSSAPNTEPNTASSTALPPPLAPVFSGSGLYPINNASGGLRNHTRHQSTPSVPRLASLTGNTLPGISSALMGIGATTHHEAPDPPSSYQHQLHPSSGYPQHARRQSSAAAVPQGTGEDPFALGQ